MPHRTECEHTHPILARTHTKHTYRVSHMHGPKHTHSLIIATGNCRVRIGSLGRPVSVTTGSVRAVEEYAPGPRRESALVTGAVVSLNQPLDDHTTGHSANAVPALRHAGTQSTQL